MICVNCLNISEVNNELYEKFYVMASAERKRRADRYRCQEDAGRCILAEALLRFSLKEACGYCPEIDIGYNEYGKPFVKGLENFTYNLSHSGEWVVAAYAYHESGACNGADARTNSTNDIGIGSNDVCDINVGIDVEKIRETVGCEKIANRFFAKEERDYIFSAPDEKEKAGRFTQVWTRKESYVKYLGSGLSKSLESFSVDGVTGCVQDASGMVADVSTQSYSLGEDYYLSVCSNDKEVVIKVISVQELSGLLF